jgi:hypothetical protein
MGGMYETLFPPPGTIQPVQHFMFCTSRLRYWVLNLMNKATVVRATPLTVRWIERNFPAPLNFNCKNTVLGVRDQEIALAILLISQPVGTQPRTRVKDMKGVIKYGR